MFVETSLGSGDPMLIKEVELRFNAKRKIKKIRKGVREQGDVVREIDTGSWRKIHDEDLHNLNSSRNIIMSIKWRRMTASVV
jgi:hypothetical protein